MQGEREAPGAVVLLPFLPPLFIGALGGAGPLEIPSKGGRRPRGDLPPKSSGALPTPRVSNPRRRGGPRGRTSPPVAGSPSHFSPWGPPG